jgi:hypothetical protein
MGARPTPGVDLCWSQASCRHLKYLDSAEINGQCVLDRIMRLEHPKYPTGWAVQRLLEYAMDNQLYHKARSAQNRSYDQHHQLFHVLRKFTPRDTFVLDLECEEIVGLVFEALKFLARPLEHGGRRKESQHRFMQTQERLLLRYVSFVSSEERKRVGEGLMDADQHVLVRGFLGDVSLNMVFDACLHSGISGHQEFMIEFVKVHAENPLVEELVLSRLFKGYDPLLVEACLSRGCAAWTLGCMLRALSGEENVASTWGEVERVLLNMKSTHIKKNPRILIRVISVLAAIYVIQEYPIAQTFQLWDRLQARVPAAAGAGVVRGLVQKVERGFAMRLAIYRRAQVPT